MKTKPQKTAELTRLCELISHAEVATLRNYGHAGALISRPVPALEMDADGALWLVADQSTGGFERLGVVNLGLIATEGNYVSITGSGELVADDPRIASLESVAKDRCAEGPTSPDFALLKVVPSLAEYFDAPCSRMVRIFGNSAVLVTDEPGCIA